MIIVGKMVQPQISCIADAKIALDELIKHVQQWNENHGINILMDIKNRIH